MLSAPFPLPLLFLILLASLTPTTTASPVQTALPSTTTTTVAGLTFFTTSTRPPPTTTTTNHTHTHTPAPRAIQAPPPLLHITLVNAHTAPLSTAHASNAGAPAPVRGPTRPGTLAVGATAAFAVPTGWAGRVVVAEAEADGLGLGLGSLVEAGFTVWRDFGVAVADVDVSYVDAYTVPIVCSCEGVAVSGCNKDLFALHTCPNLQHGVCLNDALHAESATPFFAPCSHSAYTFPADNAANSYGRCQNGHITCCVGTACPPGPNQSAPNQAKFGRALGMVNM
ncbi:hypothetical protein F4775DRAFT_588824 [Biscogniauxia sp. FL1348]|nr:hypothetical protein F4775DRAFT_588824 [Biscogniauxia sp. FL1348]